MPQKEPERTLETLEEENLKLLSQLSFYQELKDLENESFYRKVMIDKMESLSEKLERIAIALESSLEEEETVPPIKPKEK